MNIEQMIIDATEFRGVEPADLLVALRDNGWDFSPFTGTAEEVDFLTRLFTNAVDAILLARAKAAARQAAIEAAYAEAAELRERRLTRAARSNPDRQCGKCDGSGRIRAFSHIEGGVCFQCSGDGILRARG